MSLGIGIGAFVDGLNAGIQTRETIDRTREKRQRKQRLSDITAETDQAFQQAVASGEASEADYDRFWMTFALPKLHAEMLKAGDFEGARSLMEWGHTSEAREGARLFMSSLAKAQTGDPAGALDDAISAAKVKGYVSTDYKLKSQEELRTEDGQLIGYRLTIQTDEGEEIEQDVRLEDIPQIVSTLANPQAAWETQLAKREKQAEKDEKETAAAKQRAAGLEDYEAKKRIDRKYKTDDKDYEKQYQAAFKNRMETDFAFQELSDEEKDRVVREDLQRSRSYATEQKAGAGVSASDTPITPKKAQENLLVDTVTGQPVDRSQASGLRQRPRPPAPSAGLMEEPAAPAAGVETQFDKEAEIRASVQRLENGASLDEERDRMIELGISADEIEAVKNRIRSSR
ncbi:hypothetical protein [Hoeflea poritis]|uniref:Uncharacterized protein n=1 Tax=Hoeflea poritis TaxID=2993659 RepID=A0ABT4VML9_9HYPH|nr:hypothetical protein [Hoeflea poritis]MDA4845959.1 hypothetical protein [Hoeflea poritis]